METLVVVLAPNNASRIKITRSLLTHRYLEREEIILGVFHFSGLVLLHGIQLT
jgi:hypothetical protein